MRLQVQLQLIFRLSPQSWTHQPSHKGHPKRMHLLRGLRLPASASCAYCIKATGGNSYGLTLYWRHATFIVICRLSEPRAMNASIRTPGSIWAKLIEQQQANAKKPGAKHKDIYVAQQTLN